MTTDKWVRERAARLVSDSRFRTTSGSYVFGECQMAAAIAAFGQEAIERGKAERGSVTLLPTAAVDRICHDEQMVIWTGDVAGALSLAGFIRDGMSYDDVLELHDVLRRELRSVIAMALDHPEARTVMNVGGRK